MRHFKFDFLGQDRYTLKIGYQTIPISANNPGDAEFRLYLDYSDIRNLRMYEGERDTACCWCNMQVWRKQFLPQTRKVTCRASKADLDLSVAQD